MKMPALRYLLDYQQLEEEWNPASMKKADLVAAVQDLKARGPLTSAQIFERFALRQRITLRQRIRVGQRHGKGRRGKSQRLEHHAH